MKNEAVHWANEQVERMKFNLKCGDKFSSIQAKVKLKKINSLSDQEYEEYAIASYKTYLESR